jgi:hypothetical protein
MRLLLLLLVLGGKTIAQPMTGISDSTSTVFSSNWYVEEVGINSFSRPAGQFYLKRENSQLTGATEIFLKSFIR